MWGVTRYSRDGRSKLTAELPEELIQEAKAQDEPVWREITDALRMRYGMDEVDDEATHERHLDRLRNEQETLTQQIEEAKSELESVNDRIEYHEEQLRKIREQKESYEQRLRNILTEMSETDLRIPAFKSELRKLAAEEYGGASPANRDEVVEDLRSIARQDDRYDITKVQWEDGLKNQRSATADGGEEAPESLQSLAGSDDDD